MRKPCFGDAVVAQRESVGDKVTYLHGDHLGSVSVATKADGTLASRQEFGPWGSVRSGGVSSTTLNYTGQRRDDTGLQRLNSPLPPRRTPTHYFAPTRFSAFRMPNSGFNPRQDQALRLRRKLIGARSSRISARPATP